MSENLDLVSLIAILLLFFCPIWLVLFLLPLFLLLFKTNHTYKLIKKIKNDNQ